MTQYMCNNEVELGKYFSSQDIITDAFRAISETTLTYDLHTSPSGIKILAFNCSAPDYTTRFRNGEFVLVSLENLHVIDFIPTKVNPIFSINKAAVELFEELSDDLKEIENKHFSTPLVITGSGLGGYLAILSALRLQRAIDVEESNGSKNIKRPICITFGSPLVGDVDLQNVISERPQWKSSFLNVVAKKDPVGSFFPSSSGNESGSHTAFRDQDSVLEVLEAMSLSNAENMEIHDYGIVLSSILELENCISNDRIRKMEEKQVKMIRNKKNVYDPSKKLNEMKISLTYMEWYMKTRKPKGGYYDSYKNATSREEIKKKHEIVTQKRKLNQFWTMIVLEKNVLPQKEGSKLRKHWLSAGTIYRRIVEPLDIADYYKKGKRNYMDKENRHEHYTLLEKWSNEETESKLSEEKRNKAASPTEDSCFWAHVEEALLSMNDLRNGGPGYNAADIEQKLKEFEKKVMCEIKNYTLCPDIFVNGSSLMKWWKEYKEYTGSSYVSEFTEYMNNKTYESYE